MIIFIGGLSGSGKSSVAQKIADRLNYSFYDIGGLRRHMAVEQGLTLAELNKIGETDPNSDLIVDKYQENLGKTSDNFVITGRTSWYFIPHAVKIFLDVNLEEAARRILNDHVHKAQGEDFSSLEETTRVLKEKLESDNIRFKKYFNIDVYDKTNFDLYLDTTNLNKEEVLEVVWEFISKKMDAHKA